MLAASSAIGWPLVGCNSGELLIPCLGPAPPPSPVPGMTYIRASEIGCALDCDLLTGRNKYTGGAATDDGPRINAAMAGASANHPITLIIDGSALVSGLFLPAGGNWSIAGLGCGTGFFAKTGTNNDVIHNAPPNVVVPWNPGPPAPPRGMNVSLSNFTVNGNQGNGFSGNSTTGNSVGSKQAWFCSINLVNLDNITIENVVSVRSPAYHVRLSNVGHVAVSGCVLVESQGWNTDGLHFDGPANDITISNCQFQTSDDSIALNCPEGYSGNISRVAVNGCTFNSFSLMRLYTANGGPNKFIVDNVSVSNCSGQLSEAAFLIGIADSLPNSVASLTVSDCKLGAPTMLEVAENFGTITLRNVVFNAIQSSESWGGAPQWNEVCSFLRPSPIYGAVTFIGSSLTFDNCNFGRNLDIWAPASILAYNSKIENLTFNGFEVQGWPDSISFPELLDIGQGSIGQMVLNSVSSNNILAPVSTGGFDYVGSVSGAGVLATGWEFPDAVMADGVPYISASTGLPSIKINGVVMPYPQS